MSIFGALQDYLKPKKMLASFPGADDTAEEGGSVAEAEPGVGDEDITLNPRAPSTPKTLMSSTGWNDYLRKQKQGGQ